MDIVEALGVDRGLSCVVGAGGKKTTLYSVASRIGRAVVTATVRIPIFDGRVETVHVTDEPVAALKDADAWPIGLVPEREGDRYLGYDPEVVDGIAASGTADAVLVKADGARTRWLKAPNEDEPRIPAATDTVVPIASARVVGEPLSEERVHRPGRVAAITGLEPGEEIATDDVARVLASEDGGMKGVPDGATVVPLVNMVDDDSLEAIGREIAEGVLARADVPRVVLARMIDDDPLVAIVR